MDISKILIFFQSNGRIIAIHMVNIRTKDLNLLVILLVISEELNLSRASKRLGLSQPALSHALNRLRNELKNPLFVRASRGLVPTPMLLELAPRVREALHLIEILYGEHEAFNLKTFSGKIVLATTTYFEIQVISEVMAAMVSSAPKVKIQTRSLNSGFPMAELERGEVDLAIAAYFDQLPESYRMRTLGKDDFVGLCSAKNPFLKTKRNLDSFVKANHIQIDVPSDVVAPIDQYLFSRNLNRNLVAQLGNFVTPPMMLIESNLLLTCPRGLAERYKKIFDLTIFELPIKLPQIEVRMVWHERTHVDPLQIWFRELLAQKSKMMSP